MFTRDDLLEALRDCFVPALQRDVVTAGLLKHAEVHPDPEAPGAGIAGVPARFAVQVTLASPPGDELISAQLRAAVENRLLGLPQISRAHVIMLPALFPILSSR